MLTMTAGSRLDRTAVPNWNGSRTIWGRAGFSQFPGFHDSEISGGNNKVQQQQQQQRATIPRVGFFHYSPPATLIDA
jgi:hypothetical protein